jgi:hypothetical protein
MEDIFDARVIPKPRSVSMEGSSTSALDPCRSHPSPRIRVHAPRLVSMERSSTRGPRPHRTGPLYGEKFPSKYLGQTSLPRISLAIHEFGPATDSARVKGQYSVQAV